MKKSAIIVKGEWNRDDSVNFVTHKGYYPVDDNGKVNGFFIEEEILEKGVTEPIEDEIEFFNNKYSSLVEMTSIIID